MIYIIDRTRLKLYRFRIDCNSYRTFVQIFRNVSVFRYKAIENDQFGVAGSHPKQRETRGEELVPEIYYYTRKTGH